MTHEASLTLHLHKQTKAFPCVASPTSAIENFKEGRCVIAEHMTLRFPLTTPLTCNPLFSAVGVTAFDSPSFAALIAPAFQLSHVDALPNHRAAQSHQLEGHSGQTKALEHHCDHHSDQPMHAS
jgi:hypothetical protein